MIDPPHRSVLPAVLDLRAQPGTRAPHLRLEQEGRKISSHDLFSRGFVVFTGAEGLEWTTAAAQITEEVGVPVIGYRIGAEAELTDVDGEWSHRYGVGDAGAVLIRPDGYVAWRHEGVSTDSRAELTRALRQILGT